MKSSWAKRTRIWQAMKSLDRPAYTSEIAAVTGYDRSTVCHALRDMQRRGMGIERRVEYANGSRAYVWMLRKAKRAEMAR